jgi:hypothetical protein
MPRDGGTLDSMGRTWVLDLDPSGTGAEMRPLDSVLRGPRAEPELALVRPKPQPRSEPEPEPAKPHRFKVVDVLTGQVTAEDAGARATVELLRDVRSIGDVRVYVWEPDGERWRLLTLAEQRTLWALRDRLAAQSGIETPK